MTLEEAMKAAEPKKTAMQKMYETMPKPVAPAPKKPLSTLEGSLKARVAENQEITGEQEAAAKRMNENAPVYVNSGADFEAADKARRDKQAAAWEADRAARAAAPASSASAAAYSALKPRVTVADVIGKLRDEEERALKKKVKGNAFQTVASLIEGAAAGFGGRTPLAVQLRQEQEDAEAEAQKMKDIAAMDKIARAEEYANRERLQRNEIASRGGVESLDAPRLNAFKFAGGK